MRWRIRSWGDEENGNEYVQNNFMQVWNSQRIDKSMLVERNVSEQG